MKTNLRVRNCRICHLSSLDPLALLVVFSPRHSSRQFGHGGFGMNNRVLGCLIAGALATAVALASPAFARGGGGGGGGHGGGMGGGGMGGGGHGGGMGGGMHGGSMGGGMHAGGMGGGAHFAAMGGGPHFGGAHFAGAPFAHGGFSARSSRFAFHDRGRFHDRDRFHHRFGFFGGPYAYADYDSCWSRVWTPYGPQWTNLCSGYGYY
jgi:hypothetical protein